MKFGRIELSALGAVLVSACGGGGGGGAGEPAPSTPGRADAFAELAAATDAMPFASSAYPGVIDVEDSFRRILAASQTVQAFRPVSSGIASVSITYDQPQASANFRGTNYKAARYSGVLATPDGVSASSSVLFYEDGATLRFVGSTNDDGTYTIMTQPFPTWGLPTAAHVNDSGGLDAFDTFNAGGTLVARGSRYWSVAPDTPTTLMLCIRTEEIDYTDSAGSSSTMECAQVDGTGAWTGRGLFSLAIYPHRVVFKPGP